MSNYLNKQQYAEILNDISIYSIESFNHKKLSTYNFDCGKAVEYKSFLFNEASALSRMAISKTFIMVHNTTKELVGYFTLSADSIKLTPVEKVKSKLDTVPFMSLPAIKIGKLAINQSLSEKAKRKGYGSFAIEMAIVKAYETLKRGIACRFITVDADIEYYPNTTEFYKKNGFVFNEANKRRTSSKTISMRKDIFDV